MSATKKLSIEFIAGMILLGLGLVALIVWLTKLIPPKIKPGDLPNSGSGIPQGWTPSNLSDRLFDLIDGMNWTLRQNAQVFRELAELPSNDMFAAVALDYKARHGKDLFVEISNEVPVGIRDDAEHWKNAVLARAKSLNLF